MDGRTVRVTLLLDLDDPLVGPVARAIQALQEQRRARVVPHGYAQDVARLWLRDGYMLHLLAQQISGEADAGLNLAGLLAGRLAAPAPAPPTPIDAAAAAAALDGLDDLLSG